MGVTFASFQKSETHQELKELLNSIVRGLLISYIASFITIGRIQSGPRVLLAFILSSTLVTASLVKSQLLQGITLC